MDLICIEQTDMNLYSERDLLMFNDLITCPQGTTDFTVTIIKGVSERKIINNFLQYRVRAPS